MKSEYLKLKPEETIRQLAESEPLEPLTDEASIFRRAFDVSTNPSTVQKAQRLWDVFQDIKHAWVVFYGRRASGGKVPAGTSIAALTDQSNPLTQEFRQSHHFKKLQRQLAALYADENVKSVWQDGLKRYQEQWKRLNGEWSKFQAIRREVAALEDEFDALQKERFDERALPERSRRRSLGYEVEDVSKALRNKRSQIESLMAENTELAARILASEFSARRHELRDGDGFMWFKSRRDVMEEIEEEVSKRSTLRLLTLEGQSGTGKTSFIEALSKKFTNQPPLKAIPVENMKADPKLFADKTLEAGASPTEYKIILQAVTGKDRPTDLEPKHQGRVAMIDEFNKLSNGEASVVVTNLDQMKVGGRTGYHLNGANPDDLVQPKALVMAAQNPAGERFRGRTVFTPEVQRKMEIKQIPFFPQSPENPELYEAFLVTLMNADGGAFLDPLEIAPYYTQQQLSVTTEGTYKQDQLITDPTDGGTLWRLANMLNESYKNLNHQPNLLTTSNPDAKISGRVLPPGDVMQWLTEYREVARNGASLTEFLASRLSKWFESSFQAAHDAEDRRLYEQLADQFDLLVGSTRPGLKSLLHTYGMPRNLTPREVAMFSPRVPREKIPLRVEPEASRFEKRIFDLDVDGKKLKKLEVRVSVFDGRPRRKRGTTASELLTLAKIEECPKFPEFAGRIILEDASTKKRILVTQKEFVEAYEVVSAPVETTSELISIPQALNPYREALLEAGITDKALTAEKRDLNLDLNVELDKALAEFTKLGLPEWTTDISKLKGDIRLTPEKRRLIETELKNGAIGLFMPGKQSQLDHLEKALKQLKPKFIAKGQPGKTEDPYLWEKFQELLKAKNQLLVADVPDRPYLLLTKPSQKSEGLNLSLDDQKKLFAKQQAANPHLKVINPAEYAALQTHFTSQLEQTAIQSGQTPQSLKPLDTNTYSRFINLPVLSSNVPGAHWRSSDRRLEFAGDGLVAHSDDGFRAVLRIELGSEQTEISIPQALNPYREGLLDAGITDPSLTAEKRDLKLDLNAELDQALAEFTKLGLPEWTTDISKLKGDIRLTPEKRQFIESEMKNGAIGLFMPGKKAQLEHLEKALAQLKPSFIDNGTKGQTENPYLWDKFQELLTAKNQLLVADVPDRPYLMLTKPTQKPEGLNLTLDDQKKLFTKQQKSNPNLRVINPAEYAALQTQFTAQLEETANQSGQTPQSLKPLDTTTYSRFIGLPVLSGDVPFADWLAVSRRLKFDGSGLDADSNGGFRPVLRIEL